MASRRGRRSDFCGFRFFLASEWPSCHRRVARDVSSMRIVADDGDVTPVGDLDAEQHGIDHQRQAFVHEVVDHHQDVEAARPSRIIDDDQELII